MPNSSEIEHPGTIHCVDGATQEIIYTVDAEQVPSSHRFVRSHAGELTPVVKMVASLEREQVVVRSYGPDGKFLRAHVRMRDPR